MAELNKEISETPIKIINTAKEFLIIGVILTMISFALWVYAFFKYFRN